MGGRGWKRLMQFATGNHRFTSDASVTHKDGLRPKYLQQLNFSLFPRSEMERRHQPCIHSAVKQPRLHYQPTACKQLYDFTYSKHSSRKELAKANPYLEIWGFPFLKFSPIILTSYLAFMCPQSGYVAHITWLLHNKRLAGPAEIWQNFSKYLTTLFSLCHS